MGGNNNAKTVLGAIGMALLIVAIFIGGLYLTVILGYVIGILIEITPFISDWLTAYLPVEKSQIPGITAWLAVASLFIGAGRKGGDKIE